MRKDFHKVVVERPRWGSSLPSRKTGWSIRFYDPDWDYDLPSRESSSWNWNSPRKYFSDHLSPLERYLNGQVNRPWRKVEGEIHQALDTRTLIGRHLWDHALGMVALNCRIGADGRPRTLHGYPVRTLYVHPRTGILLRVKPQRTDEARERRHRMDQADSVNLDAATRAEKIGGLWYLLIQGPRLEEVVELRRDASGRMVPVRLQRPIVRKKQANTEEILRIRARIEAVTE